LIETVYADFGTMFDAFTSGSMDITDWPANSADLPSFAANPDFLLSQQQSEFGIFETDFNFHFPFMGAPSLAARPAPPAAGVVGAITYGTASGCGVGFGRFIVNLVNKETGNSAIVDKFNTLIGTGSSNPAAVTDDPLGGVSADGQYALPSPSGCMVQGPYSLTTSVYSGTVPVSLCLNQVCAPNAASVAVTLTLGLNYNSPSTQQLDNRGTEFRKAVAHMMDKPNFDASIVGFAGKLTCNSLFAAPTQGLTVDSCFSNPTGAGCPPTGPDGVCDIPQSDLNQGETGTGSAHPWFSGNVPKGYNLGPQAHGAGDWWWASGGRAIGVNTGYASLNNLRASCEHLMLAGFAATGTSNNANPTVACLEIATYLAQATQPAGASKNLVPNGHISMFVRTSQPRRKFGQIMADTINALFGTPQSLGGGTVFYGTAGPTSPKYYTIDQVADIVFDATVADDWQIYTGGYNLGTTPDHLYGLRHSTFASTYCGGAGAPSPNNYIIHCDPAYDTQAAAGEFTDTLAHANNFFTVAALVGFHTVNEVPMFSRYQQFVALNGWSLQDTGTPTASSLVQSLGGGWQASGRGAFFSPLNMRQKPGSQTICSGGLPAGCTTNPIYRPGGGDPNLIRRGLSQDVHKLSPFHALTVWDFDPMIQVFDSMLVTNPLTGGATNQVIDWMTTKHSQVVGPRPNTCVPVPPTAPPGTQPFCSNTATTQTWFLRNDLKFHDGTAVTAADVAFNIQAYRDVPSDNLLPSVATVAEINVLNSNTLQVVLLNQSPFYEVNIGGLPIVEKGSAANPNSWVSKCTAGGVIGGAGNACANPADDPMSTGRYVGSGPFKCLNLNTGVVGGSCTQNADGSLGGQDVVLGGRILLTANDAYMRGRPDVQGSSLQKLNWADVDKNGVVNILDIADTALYFGQTSTSCGANNLCQQKVAYWDSSIFGALPPAACNVNCVDIVEIATVAFYFDHGLTAPFTPAQISDGALPPGQGLDPAIDSFQIGSYYKSAVLADSTHVTVDLQGATTANGGTIQSLAMSSHPPTVSNTFTCSVASGTAFRTSFSCTASGTIQNGVYNVDVTDGGKLTRVLVRLSTSTLSGDYTASVPRKAGTAISFAASASGGSPGYTFSWNFGDGSPPVAGQNPSHNYASAGTYNVLLTTTDSASNTITVQKPVIVDIVVTTTVTNTANPHEVSILSTTFGGVGSGSYKFAYDFGEGDFDIQTSAAGSTSFTEVFAFDPTVVAPGSTVIVKVLVTDTAGNTGSSTNTVTVP